MRILIRVFAIIGILAVVVVSGVLALILSNRQQPLPEQIVLELDLEQPLPESRPHSVIAGLMNAERTTFDDVLLALNRASKDPRVKGIVARTGNPALSFAQTQELRDAVEQFRKSGRFALIHAESFGEVGNGMQPYYLATGFDQIWLQPMGDLAITGLQAELTFFRGTLDKLEVEPQFRKREEYKTFAEQFTETQASAANRESTEALVGDLFEQWVAGVAAGRNLPLETVRAAVDNAPLLDRTALEGKLVDRLAYWDQAVNWALLKASGVEAPTDAELDGTLEGDGLPAMIALEDYARVGGSGAPNLPNGEATLIAVIVGEGAIMRGESNADPLSGEESFGAATIAAAFDEAIDNPDIKAILFRVNSPGGSAVASEVVRRKVLRAQSVGKPVIVSMGAVAASGGYWVAMGADWIVAQPATITGSIGVVAGKMVTKGLTDMVGINVETVSRGANAGMWSSVAPFTQGQEEKLNAFLDATYGAFTEGVAEGRNLPLEKVRDLAKGRVYTGRQAKELGLVDALGGYHTAIGLIRRALTLEEKAPLVLARFPRQRTQFELFKDLLSGKVSIRAVVAEVRAALAADALAEFRPVLAPLSPLLRSGQDMTAMMPAMTTQGF